MTTTPAIFDRSLDGLDHRQKLERANEHIRTLKTLVERFMESEPYRIVYYHSVEEGRYSVYFKIVHQPPPDWGVIVGDCIHNLRSALDCLVFSLNIVGSNNSPTCPTRSQFPIYYDAWKFLDDGRVERMLHDVPSAAVAEIERHQPYNSLTTYWNDPLYILNELANTDKHKLLVPVVINTLEPTLAVINYNDLRITGKWAYGGVGALEHGTELARVNFDVIGPDTGMEVDVRCPIDVALPQSFMPRGYGLIESLEWLSLCIEDMVFRSLEPILLNP